MLKTEKWLGRSLALSAVGVSCSLNVVRNLRDLSRVCFFGGQGQRFRFQPSPVSVGIYLSVDLPCPIYLDFRIVSELQLS